MDKVSLMKVSLLVIAGTVFSSVVSAEQVLTKEQDKKNMLSAEQLQFVQLDSDANGQLTELEIVASGNDHLKKQFKKIDTNADGVISPEEFAGYKQPEISKSVVNS